MTSFELSELIVRKGMKSRTELLAYANEQKLIGKVISQSLLLTEALVWFQRCWQQRGK